MVSNLEELSQALRGENEPSRSLRGNDFATAFRSQKARIVNELHQSGKAELRDSQGTLFIIRKKN